MSEERSARVKSALPGRVLKSLLLAAAFVCATAQPPSRAGALRPAVGLRAAPQVRDAGGGGVIAFEAGGEIYVMSADGGAPNKIVGGKAGVVNMQPSLSPDATHVAFSSNLEGRFSIYVVGVDGEGLRRLTDGPANDSEPAWSPDGSRIAFVRGFDATGNGVVVLTCDEIPGDILVTDVDGGGDTDPVEVNLTNGLGGTDPTWSPDGSRIAFASARGEENYSIYTMSPDGGNVQRLTGEEGGSKADPAWSPDGSRIAYTGSLRVDRRTQCGTMPISGGPGGGGPALSGDHSYIYTMAADGGNPKSLTEEIAGAGPSWSPDGTEIVFAGGLDEEVQLYLIAADGSRKWVQLTFDATQKSSPSWSRASVR